VNGFQSVWLEVAGTPGSEATLAGDYRQFVLKYLTQNGESRKPYVFYNTWGRQERVQWAGAKYLTSMNLDQTLKRLTRRMGWALRCLCWMRAGFRKQATGTLILSFFPDSFKQVIAKLNAYGMKLGLWFNPTVAAVSSEMYARNKANRMSWNGKVWRSAPIWKRKKA
jgi:alpha-galactosidase